MRRGKLSVRPFFLLYACLNISVRLSISVSLLISLLFISVTASFSLALHLSVSVSDSLVFLCLSSFLHSKNIILNFDIDLYLYISARAKEVCRVTFSYALKAKTNFSNFLTRVLIALKVELFMIGLTKLRMIDTFQSRDFYLY